ncbi:hypothetical protein GCM10008967_35840 [Bacillus carboniphilus]|uniref:Ferredoxin n=1 Tax=Bacillus carboniphilus TaxID=86663 RepID=A0ABN0WNN8_9BACI
MPQYIVNKAAEDNGDHEVHVETCVNLPREDNRDYIGEFDNCADAVEKARVTYPSANGCAHCAKECHTT